MARDTKEISEKENANSPEKESRNKNAVTNKKISSKSGSNNKKNKK